MLLYRVQALAERVRQVDYEDLIEIWCCTGAVQVMLLYKVQALKRMCVADWS